MNLTNILLQSNYPFRELTEEESKKLKAVLLDIYKDIFQVCVENDLTVLLVGGSALGAIRHDGYIPWDDDLDVAMPRSDYEKFPSLLEQNFPGKYDCTGPGFCEKPELGFIKVQKQGTLVKTLNDAESEKPGIAIDVFPIENIPDNKFVRLIHGFLGNVLLYISVCVKLNEKQDCPITKILLNDREGKKTLGRRLFIGKIFGIFHKSYKWYIKTDKLLKKYGKKHTTFVSIPTGRGHYFGEIQPYSVFFPSAKHLFEGIEANVPNDSDKYLSSIYGNYMQIPPVEKREKHFIVEIDFGEK